jgi:hypothetical protein
MPSWAMLLIGASLILFLPIQEDSIPKLANRSFVHPGNKDLLTIVGLWTMLFNNTGHLSPPPGQDPTTPSNSHLRTETLVL